VATVKNPNGRWPNEARGAISVTFDNMGEAAELELGMWDPNRPIGSHRSVTTVLPETLRLLDRLDMRATFFVEAWNVEVYPEAIKKIADAGHEIGFHGWRHETWSNLDRPSESSLFRRGKEALRQLGVELVGFRPPGGKLTGATLSLMKENGFKYCSPAGSDAAAVQGTAILPFAWHWIDAYYYFEPFAEMRKQRGDSESLLPPSHLRDKMTSCVDGPLSRGGYTAILFHPFLEDDPQRFSAMTEVLEHIKRTDKLWCAPCGEVADWVLANPESFAGDPGFDTAGWR